MVGRVYHRSLPPMPPMPPMPPLHHPTVVDLPFFSQAALLIEDLVDRMRNAVAESFNLPVDEIHCAGVLASVLTPLDDDDHGDGGGGLGGGGGGGGDGGGGDGGVKAEVTFNYTNPHVDKACRVAYVGRWALGVGRWALGIGCYHQTSHLSKQLPNQPPNRQAHQTDQTHRTKTKTTKPPKPSTPLRRTRYDCSSILHLN